jgi:uncharacterized integral membrane protein
MRLIPWLLLPPAAILLIAFAIANRTPVRVSLDPLPLELHPPLFIIVILAIALGIVIGGSATWLAQRKWRRLARERRRANESLQRELGQRTAQVAQVALPARSP